MRRTLGFALIVALTTILASTACAVAQEVKGRCRIYLVDKEARFVEGEVKELPDAYEVKTKQGGIITIKKSQVKAIVPLDEAEKGEAPAAPTPKTTEPAPARRAISDKEIEDLLVGIAAEIIRAPKEVDLVDLEAELPADEKAVEEMIHKAGGPEKAKVLRMPHFVLVYTSSDESARKLGARLESVWRWDVRFIDELKLKPQRPEYKLEIYYFKNHQEFEAFSLNEGTTLPGGVLGYYTHGENRSHFFDLYEWPRWDGAKQRMNDKRTPPAQRQKIRNYINAWVEYNNQNVIQHEAGHHIHFNTGVFSRTGDPPTWLVEGTTMQFEVPPAATGQGGSGLGELNDCRLDEFRDPRKVRRWASAAELKQWLLNSELWMNSGTFDYPRGWAVVYYLWKKHRDGLGEYMRRIMAHERDVVRTETDREKEFEECFGRLDDAWFKDFNKFVDSLQVRKSRLPPPD